MDRTPEQTLRDSLIASHKAHLASVAGAESIQLSREPSDVESELSKERRDELDDMSGMSAYADKRPEFGPDLQGQATEAGLNSRSRKPSPWRSRTTWTCRSHA